MKSTPPKKPLFTDLELKIIKLVCKELTGKQIAAKLSTKQKTYSHRTLEEHRVLIQKKMGVKSILGMVFYAIRHGIIEVGK